MTRQRTSNPTASAIPAIPANRAKEEAGGIAKLARIARPIGETAKTPFARMASRMDVEYRRLRAQHPEAEKLLAEAFGAAFAVASCVMDG